MPDRPTLPARIRKSLEGITLETKQKHLLLGAATFVSMFLTYYSTSFHTTIAEKAFGAFLYSSVLVVILLSHEFGHYINAKEYGVETTLPYFIPLPFLSPFGTLGAFIRMKSMPPDRRALFDISFWGPAMSFITSVPAIIIGLLFSEQVPIHLEDPGILTGDRPVLFGTSILFELLVRVFMDIPEGYTLLLHPVAFAGWVGFFVTAINLFPIGQLDGGHIAYVFLGKRQLYIAYIFLGVLILLTLFVSPGWTFWIIMLVMMGLRHPPIRTTEHAGLSSRLSGLDRGRVIKGILSLIIFVICFIPEPLKTPVRTPERNIPAHQPEQPSTDFQIFHDIGYEVKPKIFSDYFKEN